MPRVKRMCARGLGVYTFNDKACIHRVPFGNIYNTHNMSSSTVCSGDRREGFIVCHHVRILYIYIINARTVVAEDRHDRASFDGYMHILLYYILWPLDLYIYIKIYYIYIIYTPVRTMCGCCCVRHSDDDDFFLRW